MTSSSPRTIFCQYDNQETEGLDFVPYPGAIGQRIYQHIGKNAWSAWLSYQTMLINEHRLSPRNPRHRALLEQAMCQFLFEKVRQWTPPDDQLTR